MFRNARSPFPVLLALLLAAGTASAAEPGENPAEGRTKEREERRVVVVGGEPEVRVFEKELAGLTRGYLGVELVDLTPELRAHFGAPDEHGVMVSRVESDSPAARAGVEVGDVITAVDGEAISGSWDLRRRIGRRSGGESLALDLIRDGRTQRVAATLEEREGLRVDLGPFIHRLHRGEGLLHGEHIRPGERVREVIRIDPEAMGEALERVGKALDDPAWKGRLLEWRERNRELERRLEELEGRLHELEAELERLPRER